MQFGFSIPTEPDPTEREPLRRAYDVCARAEELGFHFGVVSQHRFTAGYPLSPWVALGAIAARTGRLRLGTNIALLPLDHPLDVAEEVATVDQISGGRVFLGAGLGYRPYEYEALELPYHRRGSRMSECLEIVQQAWTQDEVSFHGEHFHIEGVSVVPKPVQQPRPPIWLGANSDAGVARAARLADGWLAGFGDRLPALAGRVASYREQAAEHGRDATVCLLRLVGIGKDRDEVEQTWLPEVIEMLRGYRRAGAPGEKNEAASKSLAERPAPTLDAFGDMFVAGTPDDCVAGIQRCQELTGCESLLATFRGPDADAQLELFGREVLPAFA
jgi:probable F420-dependent oxidoreductase